ncbi:PREDICTED: yae1 domain-containing protein 1-like isoform X2 [Tarenaya hassleriana]|uniref:yae1 domain-containing protein 1-like isoform X2 n=1 Tax=Tarenaya hassleriana TaxID=28532 RepID=UPI0008FCEFB7|nr:PREDICTED: yae1 domain-containing protein 1-like isoform X2 [Tarenaya hassleriana]
MDPPSEDVKANLAEELYGESLRLSKPGLDSASHGGDDYNFEDNDGSVWGSDEESNRESLDREWQRRRDEFHAIGYRDGIIAGKEAAAQEGFNIGFKESVLAGYKFGLVRGISR